MTFIFAVGIPSLLFVSQLGFIYRGLSSIFITATEALITEISILTRQASDAFTNLNMAVEFYDPQIQAILRRNDAFQPSVDQVQCIKLEDIILNWEQYSQ